MKKRMVVFSGAGLSAESGIPTFRDSNGLWENHKVEDVAHPNGWKENKELVLNFYKERFLGVKATEPNDAHKAIADLQDRYEVVNFTQNIDDLLERAGCADVRHMHGSLFRKKCEFHKNTGDCAANCDYVEECTEPIELGDKCPKCDGQLRQDVVWFTEAVQYEFEEIIGFRQEIKHGSHGEGVFICVGTSGGVYPAAQLVDFFGQEQVKNKYIVDLNTTPFKGWGYQLIEGLATTGMRQLEKQL
jgi:NAD-dependent deacetylase